MSKFNLDPNATYLLPSTFGPYSMAMLDMLLKDNIKPIVLFFNYASEDSIDEEERLMRQFCLDNQIILEVKQATDLEGREEDFAAWSRKVRYSFFKEMYLKYKANGLILAHTIEDLLETYLYQKREGKITKYGYESALIKEGMIIYRPLIEFTRNDLMEYDVYNQVPYSEHMERYLTQHVSTPLQRDYISKLNSIELDQLFREMKESFDEKIKTISSIKKQMKKAKSLSIRSLIALDLEEFASVLLNFVESEDYKCHLDVETITSIRKMCLDSNPNQTIKISDSLSIKKEYDVLLITHSRVLPYEYRLEKPDILETKEFSLDFSNGALDRGIKDEDYPLTIRPAYEDENFLYHGRIMVSPRRILLELGLDQERIDNYPVFINKDGKIVYVPRILDPVDKMVSKLTLHFLEND